MDNPSLNHSSASGSQVITLNEGERRPETLALPPREDAGYQNVHYPAREDADGMDFQRVLAVVTRRWPVMLGIFLASSAIGAFTAARSKPIYQASATVELNPEQQGGGGGGDIPGLGRFIGGSQSIETQIAIIQGSDTMNRAYAKVSPAMRETLSKFAPVSVAQVGTTRLLNVGVQSYSPEAAAALANAICSEYIAGSLVKNRSNTIGAVNYVANRMKEVGQRARRAQTAFKNFQERTGIYGIEGTATNAVQKLVALQNEIASVMADRQSAQARLSASQAQLARFPAGRVVPTGIEPNPRAIALQSQLASLQLDRSIARNNGYKEGSFKIQSIDNQVRALNSQLQGQARTIVSGWQPDPQRAPIVAEMAASQLQIRSINARINALQQQSVQARQNQAQLPRLALQFNQLSNEANVLQSTQQMLNQRLQGLLIGQTSRVPDARMAMKAYSSPVPVAPNRTRAVLYAMAVGLLAALGIGLLLDMMDNHIYSEDDVQRVTGLPVLVQVPLFRPKQPSNLLLAPETLTGKSSPLLETFRMLRTNIRLSGVDKVVRSVAITSSVPHEGKSNTALSLAVAAATSGDRVVLVDLDLRRPSQHRLTQLSNDLGFTSVISNQCSLEEAFQETAIPGLRVLTSGPLPPNPFRLLNSQAARTLIEQISQNADLVVIDTPPVLTMADALLISSWVDGTLLVVSSSEIRKKDVARAADMLTQNNNDLLGVILTKVNSNVDGYYSYYGYKNYNHYFESQDAIALK